VRDSLQLALDALHRTRLLGAAVALSAVLVPLTALALLARWRPPGGRTRSAALRAPERSPLSHPFEFSMFGPRYILTVREAPPGHSSCEFASSTGRWYCNGYY
jgi:hypothetical protein